jgi:cephalosporin-C deacetylase
VRPRPIRLIALVIVIVVLSVSGCQAQDPAALQVAAERAGATYQCGEDATFALDLTRAGEPVAEATAHYVFTLDGGRVIAEGELPVREGKATVASKLDEPGILRLVVTWDDAGQTVTAIGGAAYEPERIQPGADEPADFEAYWDAQKQALAAIPMDAQLTPMPNLSDDARDVYKVNLANIDGSRVYGWLAVPRSAGPHPAVLTVPWAGVYPTPLGLIDWARSGFLAMAISAHNYDVDMPQTEYETLSKGALDGYPYQGRDSRDTCYFRRVYLGCVRAVDYLVSREDWDGRSMIVMGSSQGGGLSLVTAGLDPRVTALAANVPALCDHLGFRAQRQPGWPILVQQGNAAQEATAGYFDAVNFARHAKCPAIVGVGFVDTVCSPSSVYSAYNVLTGPKQIVPTPAMGHSQSAEYGALLGRWTREQAGMPAQ